MTAHLITSRRPGAGRGPVGLAAETADRSPDSGFRRNDGVEALPVRDETEPTHLQADDRKQVLAALKAQVMKMEQQAPELGGGDAVLEEKASWRFGLDEIDARLPDGSNGGGLATDALHEVCGSGPGDTGAATGFALALLRQLSVVDTDTDKKEARPVLWCQNTSARREYGPVYSHGLRSFGLDPGRFVFVDVRRDTDLLWAMEEGVRTGCLGAVVGEVDDATFTQTRRLSLMAGNGRTPALLMRPHNRLAATAAHTRWRISAAVGAPDVFDIRAPGAFRWQIELARCRGGRPGSWHVDWINHLNGERSDETYRFRMAAATADRPAQPRDRRAPHADNFAATG